MTQETRQTLRNWLIFRQDEMQRLARSTKLALAQMVRSQVGKMDSTDLAIKCNARAYLLGYIHAIIEGGEKRS